MHTESAIPTRDDGLAEFLLEWVEHPLLLAGDDGVVFAANSRVCELAGCSADAFDGLRLTPALELLEPHVQASEARLHRLACGEGCIQIAILPATAGPGIVDPMYRAVLQNAFEAYWINTAGGEILDCSTNFAELTGYPLHELRGKPIGGVDAEGAGRIIAARLSGLSRRGFDEFTIPPFRTAPADCRLEVKLSVLPRTGGRVLGCIRDRTAIRRIETELERSRRAILLAGQCMQAARSAPDRASLLRSFCECIATAGGYAMAWIGSRDPAGGSAIRIDASAGHSLEFLDEVCIDAGDTPLSGGDIADRQAVVEVFGTAPYAPWREKAMQYGFASGVSLAVRSAHPDEFVLNVYSYRDGTFDGAEIAVLAQATAALELGLELKHARAAQQAMEKNASEWDESFRSAFESSLNGILVYDLEGKVLDANAEFCNRLGYTRQELVGMHLPRIEGTEYARQFADRVDEIREKGFAVFETAHIGRDGAAHAASMSCRTYTYGDTQIVLAISRDLVQPASEAERWLRLALEASGTGLFDWDLATNKVAYSAEWKRQLGYKDEEIGDDFGEWELRIHPGDADRVVEGITAYLAKPRETYEAEFRMRHKNGSYRSMLARGAILYDAQGKQERMLGAHLDITERKLAEQHIQQAQRLESLGRVADGVARDFEHQLTIINGYSDLALSDLFEGDPLKQRIQAIRDAGVRASALTEQLLGFSESRLPAPAIVNLNGILAGAEDMLRRLLGSGVRLETGFSPHIPYIYADARQITRLLASLALNARAAMPEGGRLTIRVDTIDELPPHLPEAGRRAGAQVRVTVSDTGAGLSDETRLRLFDPFAPGPDNAGRAGLGLATVFAIVQRHDGAITVASDAGKGTTFQVYLPAAQPAGSNGRDDPMPSQAPAGTVLVIEEEPAFQTLLTDVLSRAGYRILKAANMEQAVPLAGTEDVDVVVADAISGPASVERLRLDHPGLKCLLTSSPAGYQAIEYPHLPKPFRPADLVRMISEMLAALKDEPVLASTSTGF